MSTYLQQNNIVPGGAARPQPAWLTEWLPRWQQMLNAIQLRFGNTPSFIESPQPVTDQSSDAIQLEPDDSSDPFVDSDPCVDDETAQIMSKVAPVERPIAFDVLGINVLDVSMRQGMGLVCLTALIAGIAPFLWNWTQAASVGTALPLAQAAQAWAQPVSADPATVNPHALGSVIGETVQIVAGLSPRAPGGVAAFLSALGEWLNWPMRWLAVWIVYGLGVLSMALLLGAHTTLQRFYAVTSYAAIPLLLGGLAFIPWLGWLLGLVGLVWAVAIYFHAARAITGLNRRYMAISMIVPVAVGALAVMLFAMVVMDAVWRVLL